VRWTNIRTSNQFLKSQHASIKYVTFGTDIAPSPIWVQSSVNIFGNSVKCYFVRRKYPRNWHLRKPLASSSVNTIFHVWHQIPYTTEDLCRLREALLKNWYHNVTWTSMCLGWVKYFSIKSVFVRNDAATSRWALSTESTKPSGHWTIPIHLNTKIKDQ
jgi:hypothetical protein